MIKIRKGKEKIHAIVEGDIKNQIEDVTELIEVQNNFINGNYKKLIFEFTKNCTYVDTAVSVIIGTLPKYAIIQKKKVQYQFVDIKNHPVFKFMKIVGMYKYYMNNEIDYTGTDVIPFDHIKDEDSMNKYADMVMSLAPINMLKTAQDILASYILEIYQNGFYHSQSEIGVFTLGYWNKEKGEFTFSIYDMGVGIPEKIRKYMEKPNLSSEQCVRIAFVEGFTTDVDKKISRGLGLVRLERFIHLNEGNMTMYTDDICCIIDGEKDKEFIKLDTSIKGTLIIINIVADENHVYIVEKGNSYNGD